MFKGMILFIILFYLSKEQWLKILSIILYVHCKGQHFGWRNLKQFSSCLCWGNVCFHHKGAVIHFYSKTIGAAFVFVLLLLFIVQRNFTVLTSLNSL